MFSVNKIPGLLFTMALAAVGFVLHYTVGLAGAEAYALILGIVVGNLLPGFEVLQPGITFSEKKILGWAIALMGLQLNFRLLNLSWWIVPILLLVIVLALVLGMKVAKRFGVDSTCGYMIGVGHAICGASAIAAVSPFLNKESHHTGVSVGVVNVLGTVGMVLLPLLVLALGLNPNQAGILLGGTLQAVGNVVGAGYTVGEETGQIATLVKLGRVLMLGPVILFTAYHFHSKKKAVDRKKILPGFVLVFLLLLLLTNVFAVPDEVLKTVKTIDKGLLAVAMAAIGLQIKFGDLKSKGPRALLLGSVIFVLQIALVLTLIYGQQIVF